MAHFRKGWTCAPRKPIDHDARAIAERLRFGHLPTATVPDDFWQALRRLTRYRYHLIHDLVGRNSASLSLPVSQTERLAAGSAHQRPLGAASIALLTEFTAEDLAQMPLTALADLIAQRGRHAFDDLVATARRVQEVLRRSYPVASELDEATTFSLAAMRDHIHFLERLLRRLDQEIARRIEKVPNPLLTVVGLGPVISAGILAEIGDIQRFPGHPQLAAYAGLAWKRSQSGSFAAEDTRLVSVGNRHICAHCPGMLQAPERYYQGDASA